MFNEKRYIETLTLALKNGDYYWLNQIFEEYSVFNESQACKAIEASLKSIILDGESLRRTNELPNYWSQVSRVFHLLTDDSKQKVVASISKVETWNIFTANSFVQIAEIYCEKKPIKSRFVELNRIAGRFLRSSLVDLKKSSMIIRCLWLVNQVENDIYIHSSMIKEIIFDFNDLTMSILVKSLKKSEKFLIFREYGDLIKSTYLGGIEELLVDQKLLLNGKDALDPNLFKCKLIQRVMINMRLVGKLSAERLELLLLSLDPSFKLYGIEMNKFVELVNDNRLEGFKSGTYYTDGLRVEESGYVKSLPFINIELNSNQSISEIIKVLKSNREDDNADFFLSRNIVGQIDEISRYLCNPQIWSENRELVKEFLINLINDSDLRHKYKESIVRGLSFGYENGHIEEQILNRYLAKRFRYKRDLSFDYFDEKLITDMIELNPKNDYIAKTLFNRIDVRALEHPRKRINPEEANRDLLISVLNSDIGRYFYTVQKMGINKLSPLLTEIRKKIDCLPDDLRFYYIGYFYDIFYNTEATFNEFSFIGYSHRFRGFKPEYVTKPGFKESALKLLRSRISDELVINNITALLPDIVPDEDYLKDFHKTDTLTLILQKLIDLIKLYNENGEYLSNIKKWLVAIINKMSDESILVSNIVIAIGNKDHLTYKTLTDIYENSKLKTKGKINDNIFIYIRNLEQFGESEHEKLLKLFKFIELKNRVVQSYTITRAIESVVIDIDKKGFMSILSSYLKLLEGWFSEKDFIRIKNILGK